MRYLHLILAVVLGIAIIGAPSTYAAPRGSNGVAQLVKNGKKHKKPKKHKKHHKKHKHHKKNAGAKA